MIVVTTESVPGFDTVRVCGLAYGIEIIAAHPFTSGVKSLHTGRTIPRPELIKLVKGQRGDSLRDMITQAEQIGANAVVALKLTDRVITPVWTELVAYGTAVYVTPAQPG